jgi:serine/threonine-protein kinase HipA
MMQLQHVQQVAVYYAPTPERHTKVGRLARSQRQILFEYDPAFLGSKLELSPHHQRLAPGVITGPAEPFDGLHGVFDDSLPDGWGRLLLDRRAGQLGLSSASLTPLERLTVVGARSMGALHYEPEAPLDAPVIVRLAELAADAADVLAGARGTVSSASSRSAVRRRARDPRS